nr:glycosyltransferase [Candidatus Sigynarchaeota archaeon]
MIVPVFNDLENLSMCLESVKRSTHDDFEVLVIDDHSDFPVRSLVATYGFSSWRLNSNRGPAAARNYGADRATGDVLLFIDSDVRLQDDTIERIARAHENPDLCVLQGLASKTPINKGFGPELLALHWFYMLHNFTRASFVYSHVFSIKREIFEKIGGFDESYRPPGFGEEFEIGSRLRTKYAINVDRELLVDHRFQGVWTRGKSLYHRAGAWARVFISTRKFEKANATLHNALSGICVFIVIFTCLYSMIVPVVFVLALAFFFVFLVLNVGFLSFLVKEKGLLFSLKSIIPLMYWSLMQVIGGFFYLLKYTIGISAIDGRSLITLGTFLFHKLPSHLVLFVTARCNYKCSHCFYWEKITSSHHGSSNELLINEIKDISRSMKLVKMLTITGGEPSLRDDIPSIVSAFYSNSHTRNVTIHTNGFLTEKISSDVKAIMGSCIGLELNVSISIDGFMKLHDEIRGAEGAYNKAIQTVNELLRLKGRFPLLNVTINTCFMAKNQDEIEDFIDSILDSYSIDGFYLSLARGSCKDIESKNFSLSKYASAIRHLHSKKTRKKSYNNYPLSSFRNIVDDLAPWDAIFSIMRQRMRLPCRAGQNVLVISETGDLFPCEMREEGFGNIRDGHESPHQLLISKRAKAVRAEIKKQRCACTWECAIMNNIIFSKRHYPVLLLSWLKRKISRAYL